MIEVSTSPTLSGYDSQYIWLIDTVSIAQQYSHNNSLRAHPDQHESLTINRIAAVPTIKLLEEDQKTGSISRLHLHVSWVDVDKATGKQNRTGILLLTSLAPPDKYGHK